MFGLVHTGLEKVYLADGDIIEQTNLNRQIDFYEAVGREKAVVLAERIMERNPRMKIEPLVKRIDADFEEELEKINPDILIDCVDNLATRAIINHFAVKYKISLS